MWELSYQKIGQTFKKIICPLIKEINERNTSESAPNNSARAILSWTKFVLIAFTGYCHLLVLTQIESS